MNLLLYSCDHYSIITIRVVKKLLRATLKTLHTGCQTTDPSTNSTPTTTSTGIDTTSTDLVDQTPQGDNNSMCIGN